ncbi:MAG: ankyrin repeat family protein [Betaproteobacteria bacterium]|nr:ankyrin repeat family protein [Betaproteobacteria bacterium]
MLNFRWLALVALVAAHAAMAQVAPSAAEIRGYTGLLAAAARGDAAHVYMMTGAGEPVNVRDAYGRTPLHVATFGRHREVIVALAKARADLNLTENDRYDAVTIAAVADDVETLRLLLRLGASAKQITSRYDGTALIAAALLGHVEVVKLLIDAGAPLDHVNNLGWTALIESIVLGQGGPRHVETLRALVRAGANVNLADRHGQSPLQLARQRGYQTMVEILEQAGGK